MSHSKTVYITIKETEYELEVNSDFVIENVTVLNGPTPEHDLDPEIFQASLTNEQLLELEEKLK